jgi:two-component system chemotaxis sensor kinase CheA
VTSDPLKYFRIEARELADALGSGLLTLEQSPENAQTVASLLRYAHTLKGAARVVKELAIADIAHEVEEILGHARDEGRAVEPAEIQALFPLVDRLNERVTGLRPAVVPAPLAPRPAASAEEVEQTVRVELEEMAGLVRAVTETGVQLSAVKRKLEGLEKLTSTAALLAARVQPRAGRDARAFGDRERALVADLHGDLERVVGELTRGLERVGQELADVRDGADRLRLVPAETLRAPLARATRDAAHELGKEASFELAVGSLKLELHVLAPLKGALQQLVRNAVAHGIEAPAERRAAGKPPAGTVRLDLVRRGSRFVFTCTDDGRGVDVGRLRREFVSRGVLSEAEARTAARDELLARLLSAKVSTQTNVTQIAGRAIGLDLVRETVERLSGTVVIRSTEGHGTSVEIEVPVSIAAVRALLVEAGDAVVAIPLEAVREATRVTRADLRRSPDGDSLAHRGELLPFLPLARALGRERPERERTTWSAIVLASGGRRAAIGVDHLRGTFDVVVEPLTATVAATAIVAGAALDFEGNPELVLDADALVERAANDAGTLPASSPARLPLLVVDDSLTTRMLEQSILESAGYDVDVAVSAEQALEKAAEKRYGVFIVDVEMPGMDGFDFVARTRRDPELGKVPAILVTSRNEAADFERGQRAGASAYIVKGEFDQSLLLQKIRELLGTHEP